MDWNEALSEYVSYLKLEKNLSENTLKSYITDLRKLMAYSSVPPLELSREEVEAFVYDYSKNGFSVRSQARLISSLKSFFNFLRWDGRREDSPVELLEAPRLNMRLPDTLSEDEINQLIEAIDLSQPEGGRNRAILETLYGCGLRVSELTELKLSDLFFKENFIRVTGKGNKQRLVPISDYTIKIINFYKNEVRVHSKIEKEFEDFVFLNRRGKKLSRVMVFIIIKKLAEQAGIRKNISPHTFRHSFATHLLRNGADIRSIQLMLGHESITTTEIYTHLDDKLLRETVLKFHPKNRQH